MTPWDDPDGREPGDTAWAAGCRWLQSWWRETELGTIPGELDGKHRDRTVASMLPIEPGLNFLSPGIAKAVQRRLDEGNHSGIINRDRLYRNLLSSQPLCFNLFGHFVDRPDRILPWVHGLDPEAVEVVEIRFEWAPPRKEHFDGGSAFDAFVEYRSRSGSRFLGVECKYAENLAQTSITVRDVYRAFTRSHPAWVAGAEEALERPQFRQFWLNTLLVQSLAEKGDRFESGFGVVMACGGDSAAQSAVDDVRSQLVEPDEWLKWSSYEDFVDRVLVDTDDDWRRRFRRRYLDFAPVTHLLGRDDPRALSREALESAVRVAISDVFAMGDRVIGEGSVLDQILKSWEVAKTRADDHHLAALADHAAQVAEDLKELRRQAFPIWNVDTPAVGQPHVSPDPG